MGRLQVGLRRIHLVSRNEGAWRGILLRIQTWWLVFGRLIPTWVLLLHILSFLTFCISIWIGWGSTSLAWIISVWITARDIAGMLWVWIGTCSSALPRISLTRKLTSLWFSIWLLRSRPVSLEVLCITASLIIIPRVHTSAPTILIVAVRLRRALIVMIGGSCCLAPASLALLDSCAPSPFAMIISSSISRLIGLVMPVVITGIRRSLVPMLVGLLVWWIAATSVHHFIFKLTLSL